MARWTEEEDEFLRENYETKTDREIAERLGRSRRSVRYRRDKLDLVKPATRRRKEGESAMQVTTNALLIRGVLQHPSESAMKLIKDYLRANHYRSMEEMDDDDIVELGNRLNDLLWGGS